MTKEDAIRERIQYAENVSYVYFTVTNSKHLKSISRPTDVFSSWDCSGITKNDQKFVVEFKVRNYNHQDYLGWVIENKKLRALQQLWLNDKFLYIVYICYFNDCGICFNLSSRFKQGCNSDILATYRESYNHSTMNDNCSYREDKLVNHLHYNQDFNDKIIEYQK